MLIINSTEIINSPVELTGGANTEVFVGEQGFVGAGFGSCIHGSLSYLSAFIAGTLVSSSYAISLGDETDSTYESVNVFETGKIFSLLEGISLFGTKSSVENAGSIEADNFSAVVIKSYEVGVASTVTNSGIISGGSVGAGVYFEGMEDGKLVNTGKISGGNSAFNSTHNSADMIVLNKGAMVNDILFGAGNDTYGGTGGKVVNGSISGGAGNDTLISGSYSETFVFSTGYDKDTITNFVAQGKRHDVLDLSGWDAIGNLGEVRNHTSQHGDDLWISGGSGDVLILDHLRLNNLTKSDFVF